MLFQPRASYSIFPFAIFRFFQSQEALGMRLYLNEFTNNINESYRYCFLNIILAKIYHYYTKE